MLLVILLGVLSVILFPYISDLVIASMEIKSAVRKSLNLEQTHSVTAPSHRFRFVTLLQGVIEAIGTVFGGRPSGRKVTEPAAIALMASRVLHGFACVIRPRALR